MVAKVTYSSGILPVAFQGATTTVTDTDHLSLLARTMVVGRQIESHPAMMLHALVATGSTDRGVLIV